MVSIITSMGIRGVRRDRGRRRARGVGDDDAVVGLVAVAQALEDLGQQAQSQRDALIAS